MEAFFNVKINKKSVDFYIREFGPIKAIIELLSYIRISLFFYLRREVLIESVIGEEIMAQSKVTQKDKKKKAIFLVNQSKVDPMGQSSGKNLGNIKRVMLSSYKSSTTVRIWYWQKTSVA